MKNISQHVFCTLVVVVRLKALTRVLLHLSQNIELRSWTRLSNAGYIFAELSAAASDRHWSSGCIPPALVPVLPVTSPSGCTLALFLKPGAAKQTGWVHKWGVFFFFMDPYKNIL